MCAELKSTRNPYQGSPSFWKAECRFQGVFALFVTEEVPVNHPWRVINFSSPSSVVMPASTVISCLTQPLAFFGMPLYVHIDSGTLFMSAKLRPLLVQKCIATSRTIPHNPQENGQCERVSATTWRYNSCVKFQGSCRIAVGTGVAGCIHSVQSSLCIATNATPQERLFSYNR